MSYRQSRVHLLDLVETRTIDNNQPPTAYFDKIRYTRVADEARSIAETIAEVRFGTTSTDAILTRQGYLYKNQLRQALLKVSSQVSLEPLISMLSYGAYVYRAIFRGQFVGVAVIFPLKGDFPVTGSMDRPPSRTTVPDFPDLTDFQQVATYSLSPRNGNQFRRQLRSCLNTHMQHPGVGSLWEITVIGVVENFRDMNVSKSLMGHALARVPVGDRVMVQVEPGMEPMFQEMGFSYAKTSDNRFETIRILPEWAKNGNDLEFSMMTLRKGIPEVNLRKSPGERSGKGKGKGKSVAAR
ncbi:hypothetical protein O1611_g5278 [Lasiodiplodia mahajangana]|uniref:Uncharacterized protein n=1 Tax=Lasiodiplodia mahajangana TaxID=1108764 RepID=A0ACC2JLM5_9PEZI|nr:hypothetical protein O1611_g5278 [Lasiodiplodia mahajangana]